MPSLLPHRRHHRKASPKPSSSRRSDMMGGKSPPNSSLSSSPAASHWFASSSSWLHTSLVQARRKWTASSKENVSSGSSSTLLPTTYASSTATTATSSPGKCNSTMRASSVISPAVGAVGGAIGAAGSGIGTCNSFLMGGHYYPGKDKKRKHIRKRALWYKLFCSSPPRSVVSSILFFYIVVHYILAPAKVVLLQIGQQLTRTPVSSSNKGLSTSFQIRPSGDWLQFDPTLHLSSLFEERSHVLKMASERARVQFDSTFEHRHSKRIQLFGQIVPKWFHRNGDPTNSDKKQQQQQQQPQQQQEQQQNHGKDSDAKSAINPAKRDTDGESKKVLQPNNNAKSRIQISPRRYQISGGTLQLRTLQTMEEIPATQSSCGVDTSATTTIQTTLVIQTTINRLWILNETCKRWKDPIIVTVFVPLEASNQDKQVLDTFWSTTSNCPQLELIQYNGNAKESAKDGFPVNRLRNVALDLVRTSHILVMDVDFVPANNLHETIRSELAKPYPTPPQSLPHYHAMVVPAFERLPPNYNKNKQKDCTEEECASYLKSDSNFLPQTFEDLQTCTINKDCIVFQSRINWEGHYSTNSAKWLSRKWYDEEDDTNNNAKANDGRLPSKVSHRKKIRCFGSLRYEPYVVIPWCPSNANAAAVVPTRPLAPYYDERFYGYGKNKIEYISHLRLKGYQFSILPEGFITHNPHPESTVKKTWNDKDGSDLHTSMDSLYPSFLKEVRIKYKHVPNKVGLCQ